MEGGEGNRAEQGRSTWRGHRGGPDWCLAYAQHLTSSCQFDPPASPRQAHSDFSLAPGDFSSEELVTLLIRVLLGLSGKGSET